MESPSYILYEHCTGYSLFRLKEFEAIGNILPQVEAATADISKFASVVQLLAFAPFQSAANALENSNCISEGAAHPDLVVFLETNITQEKKVKTKLGIADGKLAASVSEALPYVMCLHTGVVPEVLRGIRLHYPALAKGLTTETQGKAQLGLGHSYSRAKVKFNVNRVDNMIIQSISLLDQLDKDINTFSMRIREWYSYHFPELYKTISDQYQFCRCVQFIRDRRTLSEESLPALAEILAGDEAKAQLVLEASRMSMGMDISELDLMNIDRFANRVIALGDYRKQLQGYLRERMSDCAPSLSTLIGDTVGARLISHAGSLTNLAKYPASTIQILGAEKALFRALKTKGNTPKYGLLFHSTYIGRAQGKNKGRISRYLANKCALASRIDCFSEVPVATFGEHLKQQVEDRLKFFDTNEAPKKNLDVMKEASAEAVEAQAKVIKKRKKRAKKEKKEREANGEDMSRLNGDVEGPPRKRVKSEAESVKTEPDTDELNDTAGRKKKKKRKQSETVEEPEPEPEPEPEINTSSKKKKKKQKLADME